MSLTSALGIAQTALTNTSRQTSIVSRNISDANNLDYTRRSAAVISMAPGSRIISITRAANESLFRESVSASSAWHAQSVMMDGLDRLALSVNGVDNASSPAALTGRLQEALQTYSATPSSATLADAAIEAGRDVVSQLNNATQSVQKLRSDMDRDIKAGVQELNDLLAGFGKANSDVLTATRLGRDPSEALDQRDAIVKKIGELVPVTAMTRGDNDMVLVSGGGDVLFDTSARQITFEPRANYGPGVTGNQIYVDGTPLSAGSGSNTDASGRLAAQLQMRDDIAPKMQGQLDEIARGLIKAFAETDTTGTLPDRAGLFTYGTGDIPADGVVVPGLAGLIRINTGFDPLQGGNSQLLRDGGFNGADYVANAEGHASFTGNISRILDKIDTETSFDGTPGVEGPLSLSEYALGSISWLEGNRQNASRALENKGAMMMRTAQALSNDTGVNIDQELTKLLELEQSYAASAKLMQVANDMLATLMASVR